MSDWEIRDLQRDVSMLAETIYELTKINKEQHEELAAVIEGLKMDLDYLKNGANDGK